MHHKEVFIYLILSHYITNFFGLTPNTYTQSSLWASISLSILLTYLWRISLIHTYFLWVKLTISILYVLLCIMNTIHNTFNMSQIDIWVTCWTHSPVVLTCLHSVCQVDWIYYESTFFLLWFYKMNALTWMLNVFKRWRFSNLFF